MNKIKQNKITFFLILSVIAITFSSLTFLSLPVLFNYKSKVTKIEKNFNKNFKIFLKTSGNISYKPFPKPHLLVENATLNLSNNIKNKNLIDTSNLKIFISLRDIYLRSFENISSAEISDSNIEFTIPDLKKFREHLYYSINKPIYFNKCKFFVKNKNDEVILISPIKNIIYKINNKSKFKNFIIDGEVFGIDFKSEWRRQYDNPKISINNINLYSPNIEIKNIFKNNNNKKFQIFNEIIFGQDKLKYEIKFNDNKINITSPKVENINFNIDGNIQVKPFYFDIALNIKNKKIEKIIDNFLIYFLLYDKNYLGNINGNFEIKLDELDNKLIKKGEINFIINEKKIKLKNSTFDLHKIGKLNSQISYEEELGKIKFFSKNKLIIKNHIEFAKMFQIASNKAKNINQISFQLEKNINETDFTISNIIINNVKNNEKVKQFFTVKNIQNLRSHIRKVLD